MTEPDHVAKIEALRQKGADRLDPVRFRFIEALATRTQQHNGEARFILDGKLSEALAAYTERQQRAIKKIPRATAQASDAPHSPLAGLVRQLAQYSAEITSEDLADDFGSRTELKSIRDFRNTWSRLSVDRQVKRAIEQAPDNAGPLNSHRLVLQSLGLMRDLSPDYLARFMSYVDTLLALDQADKKIKVNRRRSR